MHMTEKCQADRRALSGALCGKLCALSDSRILAGFGTYTAAVCMAAVHLTCVVCYLRPVQLCKDSFCTHRLPASNQAGLAAARVSVALQAGAHLKGAKMALPLVMAHNAIRLLSPAAAKPLNKLLTECCCEQAWMSFDASCLKLNKKSRFPPKSLA